MNELIQVTTSEQGSLVVSARELWLFLGVKKQFADWIKNRLDKYELVEGKDYSTFSLIGEKGRPTTEYALSLNAAKELAMVEGNAKGKQARLYFIAKEEQLRQVLTAAPSTTEQALIQLMSQTNQLMAAQQQMMNELRADVEELRNAQQPLPPAPAPVRRDTNTRPPRSGQQLGLPGIPPASRPAGVSLRQQITRHVADYSAYQAAPLHATYVYLYKRMFEVYSVSVHRLNRQPTESMLDVLERYGQLERLHSLVVNELLYPHD